MFHRFYALGWSNCCRMDFQCLAVKVLESTSGRGLLALTSHIGSKASPEG